MDLAEPGEKWTVQNDDFFNVGKWSGAEKVSGIAEIKKGFSGEVGKVLSHSENFLLNVDVYKRQIYDGVGYLLPGSRSI